MSMMKKKGVMKNVSWADEVGGELSSYCLFLQREPARSIRSQEINQYGLPLNTQGKGRVNNKKVAKGNCNDLISCAGEENRVHLWQHIPRKKSYKEAVLDGTRPCSQQYFNSPPPRTPKDHFAPAKKVSFAGRCFRCLGRDHRAAKCRDPVRCAICLRTGHKAKQCRAEDRGLQSKMDKGQLVRDRLPSIKAFVPLTEEFFERREQRRNALLVDVVGPSNLGHKRQGSIANGLARRFGGYPTDFLVARHQSSFPCGFKQICWFKGSSSLLRGSNFSATIGTLTGTLPIKDFHSRHGFA